VAKAAKQVERAAEKLVAGDGKCRIGVGKIARLRSLRGRHWRAEAYAEDPIQTDSQWTVAGEASPRWMLVNLWTGGESTAQTCAGGMWLRQDLRPPSFGRR